MADTLQYRTSSKPLDAFPVVRSRNIEEIRQAIIGSYGARRLKLPHTDGFEFRANFWQSQNTGLSHVSFEAPLQLEFASANFFRQAFVWGGAEIRFEGIEKHVTSDESCVVPPEELVRTTFARGFEHFGLRIEAGALLTKLAALIGAAPSRKLVFDQATRADGSSIGNLRRLLMFLVAELDSTTSPLAVAELEQALIVSFICSNRHNYSAFLDDRTRPVATWQVRRAEEYIEISLGPADNNRGTRPRDISERPEHFSSI